MAELEKKSNHAEEIENPFLLGPFFDVDADRTEIIPACFEEAHEPLSLCMSKYEVRSNEVRLNAYELEITNKDVTAFIQEDWNRVFGPKPPTRGFLLAYRAGAFAAGRVAEEILLRKLLNGASILNSRVAEYLLFSEAQERGLVSPRLGSQSDDLILVLNDGRSGILESKAAFAGSGYLRKCIPKAIGQISATLVRNDGLSFGGLALIDLRTHRVALATYARAEILDQPDAAAEAARSMIRPA